MSRIQIECPARYISSKLVATLIRYSIAGWLEGGKNKLK